MPDRYPAPFTCERVETNMGWLNDLQEYVHDHSPAAGIEKFAASIEPEWIEEALALTGKASIRRRKLPAEQVIWLVLGMALYMNRSIRTVRERMGLLPNDDDQLAPSAATKARYRLGPEPMAWLFSRVCQEWSPSPGIEAWHGKTLWGIDGTHVRVPDTDENLSVFGKPACGRGAAYPQARIVALMNLDNRMLADARIGPFATSERMLAAELWQQIPDHSITLIDRGFTSYMTLLEIIADGQGRDFLVRLKKDAAYEVVEELKDGSLLALLHPPANAVRADKDVPGPIEIRVLEYQHHGGEPGRLATTLVDPSAYSAESLVELYHARWDLEIGFDEFKTDLLERKESLRSKKPEGVKQELWAQLLIYNLVRRKMLLAAEALDFPPRRISFKTSLLYIRDFWTTGWMVSPGNVPRTLAELRGRLRELLLPARRRDRRYPRHVKIKMTNYPRNRSTVHRGRSSK